MKPGIHRRTSQNLAMTPQLLQSIRLLQLPVLELEQELQEALASNVMLEQDDAEPTAGDPEAADVTQPALAIQAAAPPVDARLAALEQLQLTIDGRREAIIAEAIIDAIDDNGYLEQPLDAIIARLGPGFAAGLDEVEAVLDTVQAVEPGGYAARNLAECLCLQLRALPAATKGRDLAEFIAAAALEQVARKDTRELEQALGVSHAAVGEALTLIRGLNPKPAATPAASAETVVPDLVIGGKRGAWKVELNAACLPRLRINRLYERLLGRTRTHQGLREQLQQARGLVRGLGVRQRTLLRAARVVFQRQQAFLERGEEGMAPLTLREVAEAIAANESTVCRVTRNKWVQTPWGIYPLKAFFASHIAGLSGETSGTAVKAMIRRIINGESRAAPFSDGAIAAQLLRQGICVARRTVAKYREAMQIAVAKVRAAPAPRTGAMLTG